MDVAELFKLVAEGARVVGAGVFTHTLEVIGLGATASLAVMKAYTFGRDKVLRKVKHFIIAEEGFWNRAPSKNVAKHIRELANGLPILTVVNFKGGVGKTTIASNLIAYYDSIGMRVLAIDLDYQGSLTDCMISTDANLKIGAADLLNEEMSTDQLLRRVETPKPEFKNTDVLAAAYSLSRAENKAVFNWLVNDTRTDLRYNLHNFLSSQQVRDKYDLVIIDAPPRLMMATVNAVCASTHAIIPTILDGNSTRATVNTVAAIEQLAEHLSPSLKIAGVVPTFVAQQTRFQPREQQNLAYLRHELSERVQGTKQARIPILEEQRILHRAAIANVAGDKVAFFEDAAINEMFSNLGFELAKAFGGPFLRKVQDESRRSPTRTRTTSPDALALGRQVS